jgi:DNA-binding CsgD family transcriptional regulator
LPVAGLSGFLISTQYKGIGTRLIPVAIELAIYGLVAGLIRLSPIGDQHRDMIIIIHLLFRIAFSLTILLLILREQQSARVSLFSQIALLFTITALVIINFFGSPSSTISIAASTCARSVVIILLWLILAILSSKSSRHPYVVFGIGWALYMAAISAGMVINNLTGIQNIFSESLVLDLSYFLVVTTILIFSLKKDVFRPLLEDQNEGIHLSPDNKSLEALCDLIGIKSGLTRREIDVTYLICKGRSKGYIARQLNLSENTIRSYAKSAYSKIGVHNRQELIDAVESIRTP